MHLRSMIDIKVFLGLLGLLVAVNCAPQEPEAKGISNLNEGDLQESSAEAIGDRIMEEMNNMKEKFDTALNKIGEEITKDEEEQNAMKAKEKK